MLKWVIVCVSVFVVVGAIVFMTTRSAHGPRNGTVLIIRHAEKLDSGGGLSQKGQQRADALVEYIRKYQNDGHPIRLSAIYAASDTKESQRPRVSVEPVARSLGLRVESDFKSAAVDALADDVCARRAGQCTLICWRHGEIPALVEAFGVKVTDVIPDGKWPDSKFDWVIELNFDQNGIPRSGGVHRKSQHLLAGDPL
jgi:hypothetical protein